MGELWLWLAAAALIAISAAWSAWHHHRTAARDAFDRSVREARRAVSSAEVVADTTTGDDAEADDLLAQARGLLSSAADARTADRARDLAAAAERRWRERERHG